MRFAPFFSPHPRWWSLLGAVFGCLALQCWRPYFFLTDDNLTGQLPFMTEIGRHLLRGESPFISQSVLGGNYSLLNDPGALGIWSPFTLLLSLLTQTPWRYWTVDIFACANLMLAATAFAQLLVTLRQRYDLALNDVRIVLISLSYAFSAYAIIIGSSWACFLPNLAALPILMLGVVWPHRNGGALLIAFALFHSSLGGHLHLFFYTLFFMGWFILGWSWAEKSREPLYRFFFGGTLTLLITSPFFLAALDGFLGVQRGHGLALEELAAKAVPLRVALLSPWLGSFSQHLGATFFLFGLAPVHTYALGCTFAAWLWFDGAWSRSKKPRHEFVIIVMLGLTVLMVWRPEPLALLMSHVPIYRSLRWPFRELWLLVFFLHLWIAFRPVVLPRWAQALTLTVGLLVFSYSLSSAPPPSFLEMTVDRQLLISGQAERYWARLRPTLGAYPRIATVVNEVEYVGVYRQIPWTLLGSYNYAALFDVTCVSGYMPMRTRLDPKVHELPLLSYGFFGWKQIPALQQQDPDLIIFKLVSVAPWRIQLLQGATTTELDIPALLRE